MHRIDHPTATADNRFTPGNPATATSATRVTADWANAIQEELAGVIEAAGLPLDKDSNAQLVEALQALGLRSASDKAAGVVALATEAQAIEGEARDLAVPPAALRAALMAFAGDVPIGGYVEVQLNLPGAAEPDPAKYIRLAAGMNGAGQYNEGKLGNESVGGTAPLLSATASVADPDSPLYGATIRLLETERRFLRPGNVGTREHFAMERVQGSFDPGIGSTGARLRSGSASGAFTLSTRSGNQLPSAAAHSDSNYTDSISFDSNRVARTADETRPSNIGVAIYMRIK